MEEVYHNKNSPETRLASGEHARMLFEESGEDPQPAGFTQIQNAVIRDSSVSINARMTYILLESYDWAEGQGRCYPGQETLAGHLGRSVRQVHTYLDELVEAGWITKQHRPLDNGKNRTDLYKLHRKVEPSTSTTDRKPTSDPDRKPTSDEEYSVYEHSSLRASKEAQGENQEEQEVGAGRKPIPTTSSPVQPTGQQVPATPGLAKDRKTSVGQAATTKLIAKMDEAGHDLPANLRGKYGGIFRNLALEDGELEKVVGHIAERWPDTQLLPDEALREIRGDRKSAKGQDREPSLPAVVEAIKAHPYFGETGSMKGMALWEVAETFDFAGSEQPPMGIRYKISPDRQECDRLLVRLRSIATKAVKEAREEVIAKMGPVDDRIDQEPAARIASPGLEESPEGSTTPSDVRGRDADTLSHWYEARGLFLPAGQSEDIERVATVLQDADRDSGRVFARHLEGRLAEKDVIGAVSYEVWGQSDPPSEHAAQVREVVGWLSQRLGSREVVA